MCRVNSCEYRGRKCQKYDEGLFAFHFDSGRLSCGANDIPIGRAKVGFGDRNLLEDLLNDIDEESRMFRGLQRSL